MANFVSIVLYCSLFGLSLELYCFYSIFSRPRQYILLHPQYGINVPQQNGNDRASTAEFMPKVIPPPIETIKPEKEPEKHGTNDKETPIQEELQPTKPFYYVLPPLSQILFNNPQTQLTSQKLQNF